MGLFDWLVSDKQGAQAPTRRTSNPIEVVDLGGQHGDTIDVCTGCEQRGKRCKCDPAIGRKRKWWE